MILCVLLVVGMRLCVCFCFCSGLLIVIFGWILSCWKLIIIVCVVFVLVLMVMNGCRIFRFGGVIWWRNWGSFSVVLCWFGCSGCC